MNRFAGPTGVAEVITFSLRTASYVTDRGVTFQGLAEVAAEGHIVTSGINSATPRVMRILKSNFNSYGQSREHK